MDKQLINGISEGKAITSLAYNKSHFIKFSEYLAVNISIDASIIIGILVDVENLYLSKYDKFLTKTKDFFPIKTSYIERRVGLSYHKQKIAFGLLRDRNLLSSKKWEGNIYLYSINHTELSQYLIEGALNKIDKQKEDENESEELNKKFEELEAINAQIKCSN